VVCSELPAPLPTTPPVHYFAFNRYSDDVSGNDVIHATGKPFRGKLFVIVDPSNSSATFQFARLIKEKRLGTLVGEPTGGNLRGINGGAFFFLRLPKSEIEMDLPLIGTFPESAQPDSGLDPDIFVAPSVEDLIAKRDPVLQKIADLTKNIVPPDHP
jgi:C-terminal processing protease CtpA/Prc